MPDIETQAAHPRPTPARSYRAIAIPSLGLVAAMGWYVAMRAAEERLLGHEETRSIDLARKLMTNRRELDRKRLENDSAIIAYDPRLATMLSAHTPQLVEEFVSSISKLSGSGVAVLSTDGALIATNVRGLDEAALRSSSVLERARTAQPPQNEYVANLARSGFWIIRGEEQRILQVAASVVRLGEPVGLLAITTSLGDVLREVRALSGVAGAILVGNEVVLVEPADMRETFASFSNVVPGSLTHVTRGDRELVLQVDQIDATGLGIRAAWIDEAQRTSGAFDLLLWLPVGGALLLGLWAGLTHDRWSKSRTR